MAVISCCSDGPAVISFATIKTGDTSSSGGNTQRLAGIESDLQVWWNTLAAVVDGLEESPISASMDNETIASVISVSTEGAEST